MTLKCLPFGTRIKSVPAVISQILSAWPTVLRFVEFGLFSPIMVRIPFRLLYHTATGIKLLISSRMHLAITLLFYYKAMRIKFKQLFQTPTGIKSWHIYETLVGKKSWLLITNFCPVLNVVCFLLGNSPASEFLYADISEYTVCSFFMGK